MAELAKDKIAPRKKSKVVRWVVLGRILGAVGAAGCICGAT